MYKQKKKSWKYTSVLINPGEKEYIGSTVDGSGDEIKVYRRNNPVYKSIKESEFISYRVDINKMKDDDFVQLSITH